MEKEILKIIKQNDEMPFSMNEKAAKEISQLVHTRYMKFVEWISSKGFDHTGGKYYSDTDEGYVEFTIDELFTYWQDNIEKQSTTYTTPTEKCNTKECPYIKAQSENLKNMTGKY
jgi:hypothetical protein